MHRTSSNPRITRLTPLSEATAWLLALEAPVPLQCRAVASACGKVLGREVRGSGDVPRVAVAAAEGWAVAAEDLTGATPYSAALLAPPPAWVEAGDALPSATDAVLPPEAVTLAAPGMAEVSAETVAGERVRAAGENLAAGEVLLAEGTRIAPHHLLLLAACGVAEVQLRVPKVRLVIAGASPSGCAELVRLWLERFGADVCETVATPGERLALSDAFRLRGVDLVLSVGGTGQGQVDCAVAAMNDAGGVEVQGVAIRPGSTAAFGQTTAGVVLLLPGQLDELLAGLLLLAQPVLATLTGQPHLTEDAAMLPLADKVVSAIGVSEVFLALAEEGGVRPVALDGAGFADLAQAQGWFVVAPGQEGFAAGEAVQVRSFSPR